MAAKSTKEIIGSGKLKTYLDPRIIKALGHPIREHILAVLNERIASGKQIADELETDVSLFYHHIEELLELGCIELVNTKQRRGGKEHFFRAKATVVFSKRDWRQVPESVQSDIVTSDLQLIWNEVDRALLMGTFAVGGDRHVSWIPGVFDRLGWEEAMAAMEHLLFLLMQIQKQSAERVAAAEEPGIPATIAMMCFGTPRLDQAV